MNREAAAARDQLGHQSLKELVVSRIRRAILEGELELGSRLVETTVAAELGISRGPVREAFLDLCREGLLVINPRRGASVSTLSPDDIWQLYTLRAHLEVLLIRHGLRHVTAADLEALTALAEEMGELLSRPYTVARIIELDLAFHGLIAERCPYPRLVEAYRALDGQVGAGIYTVVKVLPGTMSRMKEKHLAVVRALRDGKLPAAEALLEAHWMETADKIQHVMRSRKEETE